MSIPIRLLIISDTHDRWPYSDSNPAPKVDVLLHCGDLTQVGGLPAFCRAIENIKTIDAELKLVIAGNHDLELDEKWVHDNMEDEDDLEGSAKAIAFFKAQKKHGVYYLEEGRHSFTLKNEAKITNMPLHIHQNSMVTHSHTVPKIGSVWAHIPFQTMLILL
jgi:predicted phosphodiesterase